MQPVDIRTARLWIRALRADDVEPLARLWADPRVTAFLGGPRDFTRVAQTLAADAAAEPLRHDLWPVIERKSGRLVGHCGILDKEVEGVREYELVYVLHPDFWGRGYASEAAAAVRDDAFDRLGLARVIALIEPGNNASAQVAERVGLRFEKEVARPGDRRMRLYALERRDRPGGLEERLTARLRLVALSTGQLRLLPANPLKLERHLGISLSREMLSPTVRRAIAIKLDKIRFAPPEQIAWYTYWLMMVRTEQFGAGLAGFKGAPDGAGSVEIGYGIDPRFGGQGYTTETVGELVAWAFARPGCRVVSAETHVDNLASQRVLIKNGFQAARRTPTSLFWEIVKY